MTVQVRCPSESLMGERCGRLLLEIGEDNRGPLHCKCARCKRLTIQMSSEVVMAAVARRRS